MNIHKINILFVISISRIRKDGKAPLNCRLTYNKRRKMFSTGLFVNPDNWNSKKQKILSKEPQNEYLNSQLTLIKTKINRGFLMLQIKVEGFTVEDIFNMYKGVKTEKHYNTYEHYERFLKRLKTLVEVDLKPITWRKYYEVNLDIKSFIKWKFKTNDYPLKKLSLHFLEEFEYYLKVDHN